MEQQPRFQQFHDIWFSVGSVKGLEMNHQTGNVTFLFHDESELPVVTTKIPVKLLTEAAQAFQRNEDWAIPQLERVVTDGVLKNLDSAPARFQLNQCCMVRNIYNEWLMGQIRAVKLNGDATHSYSIDVPGFGRLWTRTEKEIHPICDPSTLQVGAKVILCDAGVTSRSIYSEGVIDSIDHDVDHCIVKRFDGCRDYEGSIDEIVATLG